MQFSILDKMAICYQMLVVYDSDCSYKLIVKLTNQYFSEFLTQLAYSFSIDQLTYLGYIYIRYL